MEYIQEQIPKCLLMKIHHPPKRNKCDDKKENESPGKSFLFHKNKICTVSTPTTMGYG